MDKPSFKIPLTKEHVQQIAKIFKDRYDATLIEADAYPTAPVYKPRVQDPCGKKHTAFYYSLGKHMGKVRMRLKAYGGRMEDAHDGADQAEYDLGEPLSPEEIKEVHKAFRKQQKEADQLALKNLEKIKLFDRLGNLTRIKTCPFLEQKKLVLPKGCQAFATESITIPQNEGFKTLKNCVVVPFYHARDGYKRPCGLQVRTEGKEYNKHTASGSLFKDGAYSVVQEGKELFDLGITKLLIVESWSTGCALARALDEDWRIICSVGIGTVRAIHDSFVNRKDAEKYYIVHALDKTKKDKPRDPKVEDLKADLNETGYNYIQLPKGRNDGFYEYTDFGDVLEKQGLPTLKKWLKGAMRLIEPTRPEVINHDDRDFHYKVPWSNKVMVERKNKILDSSYVSPMFCRAYANAESFMPWKKRNEDKLLVLEQNKKIEQHKEQLDAGEIEYDKYLKLVKAATVPEKLLKDIRKEIDAKLLDYMVKTAEGWAQLSRENALKGVGAYIENDTVILNTKGGRFLYRDGSLKYTDRRVPIAFDKYADMCKADKPLDVQGAKFTRETAETIRSNWMSIYKEPENRELYEMVIGYNLVACYSSLLERRANMWSYGDSGTGKSTSFRSITGLLFAPFVYPANNTTLAGLVDAITEDGSVVACDSVKFEESNSKFNSDRRKEEEKIREFVKNQTDSVGTERVSLTSNPSRTHQAREVQCSFQFSSVNLPGKMGKEFVSRVCFIPFIPDAVGTRIDEIKKAEAACKELQPQMLDLVARGAKLIVPAVNAALTEVSKILPNSRGELSHKPITMASVLAGYIVMELVADGSEDVKGYAERIVKSQEEQLLKQITIQRTQINDTSTLVPDLKRLAFKPQAIQNYVNDQGEHGLGEGNNFLVAFLRAHAKSDKTQYDKLVRESGCWITKSRGSYGLRFKANELNRVGSYLRSNNFIDSVSITLRDVGDLASSTGSGVRKDRMARYPGGGDRKADAYTIDITDVYERIEADIKSIEDQSKEEKDG